MEPLELEGGVVAMPGMVGHSNSNNVMMSNPYRQNKTNRALNIYSLAVTVGCVVLFVAFGKKARDAAQLDDLATRLMDMKFPPEDLQYTVEVNPQAKQSGTLNMWLSTKTNSTAVCYVSASYASCRNADFHGSMRFGEEHQGRQLLVPNQQPPNEDLSR